MRRFKLLAVTIFVGALAVSAGALMFAASSASAQEAARTVLPQPDPPFKGKIGLTSADSVKNFPKDVTAPEGAPNILLILTDDVGFGASSAFGGPISDPDHGAHRQSRRRPANRRRDGVMTKSEGQRLSPTRAGVGSLGRGAGGEVRTITNRE